MNQIGWEMRHSLPNPKYYDFVTKWLLNEENGWDQTSPIDPFAVSVPEDELDDIYVIRKDAERLLRLRGNGIVVGPEGSGKTALFRILPRLLREQPVATPVGRLLRSYPLVVGISLEQITGLTGVPGLEDHKTTILSSQSLCGLIFNAFWEELICNQRDFLRFYPVLRRNRLWREQLPWFYHHYSPVHSILLDEWEFMAWLVSPQSLFTFDASQNPVQVLRELIQFVTLETEGVRAYARVVLAIDTGSGVSEPVFSRLARDVQTLYELELANLEFKLFAEERWRDRILSPMSCVKRGQVPLTPLPRWTAQDLREPLYLRLLQYRSRLADKPDYPWGKEISTEYLDPDAQAYLVEAIIEAALRVYHRSDSGVLDAPVHALRVARALIAACAGTWSDQGFFPPLKPRHLDELIEEYWGNDPEPKGTQNEDAIAELTTGERDRLKKELQRHQARYDTLTKRICAYDIDIGRATWTVDKQVLEERRKEQENEREAIKAKMIRIEAQLGRQ